MKIIVLFGVLGLSMAGFRGDLKKVGHFIDKHHKAIESGLIDAGKVGIELAGDSFVDVTSLIQDGIKTIGDATQQKKNISQLIQDGIKIVGDLTANNGNSEEVLCFMPTDPSDGAESDSEGGSGGDFGDGGLIAFLNVDGLIQDGIKTVGDATQKKKNVSQLIQDGLKIVGDLTEDNSNSEEVLCFMPTTDASDGAESDGPIAFVDVDGLIQDGIKTVGDATQKKKNVSQLIQDGLKIVGDLTENNGNSEEVLCFMPTDPSDGAESDGPIAFVNVDGLIQDGIKTVGDATQKKKDVGQLIQDGLKIVGDLTENNGNSEEVLCFMPTDPSDGAESDGPIA